MRRRALAAGALLGLALTALPTVAQTPPDAEQVGRENAIIVATLVRTALVALHQANVTGNYTVLRDLAAPGFSSGHTAADLARIFAPIREDGIDLGAVVVLDPQLAAPPIIDDNGFLRIEGGFATRPEPIAFLLLFEAIDGGWRLFGLSVNPVRPAADAAAGPADPGLSGAAAIVPQSLMPPMPRPRPAITPDG